MDLIPQFGGLLWTLAAFVVALSIIVAVHEYGHYIVGRWCGIKADVFSIGFGPVIASRMDRHGTRWQLAALPLGGYVKFRGDGNAASVGDDGTVGRMSEAERATTMTGASLWRRSATVAAGPVFNFILSILVFGAFVLFSGTASEAPVIGETKDMPAEVTLLQPGDRVTAVEGRPVATFAELAETSRDLPLAETHAYEILRDGQALTVDAAPLMPARVEQVNPRSAAWDIGLQRGDVVRAIDGAAIHSFQELQAAVEAGEGAPMRLDVWRDGEMLEFTLDPRKTDLPQPDGSFETRYLIGITGALFFEPLTESAGPWQAVTYGVEQTIFVVRSSLSALAHIVTGAISTCNLSGPVGIAEVSGAAASQGFATFVWMIAVLSTAVGMLNLFPIPVLDGGHLVFHAYEAVRGRPPSDGAVRVLMSFGIAMMLALMVFATFNDLVFCP
jgi:regulator of sigma E protease